MNWMHNWQFKPLYYFSYTQEMWNITQVSYKESDELIGSTGKWSFCFSLLSSCSPSSMCVAYGGDSLDLQLNNLWSKVKGISSNSWLFLMCHVFTLWLCSRTKGNRRREGPKRRSEGEQVLECLMADSVNGHCWSMLIEGRYLCFVCRVSV